MSRVGQLLRIAAIAVLVSAQLARGRKHDLVIADDPRQAFSIESFGFNSGGTMTLVLTNYKILPGEDGVAPSTCPPGQPCMGFIARKAQTQSSASSKLQQDAEEHLCSLANQGEGDLLFDLSQDSTWANTTFTHTFTKEEEGLYDLEFERCDPAAMSMWGPTVSFELVATFVNPGPDYLSAGQSPLPEMYLVFAVLFFAIMLFWCGYMLKNRSDVHHIHSIMATLVLFKALSLLFEAVTFHYVKQRGEPIGWNVVFYFFTFVKGVMMFVVILLIGTGWSFLKPFLNQREKRIMMAVIPLQVLANVAVVVLGESAPGSQEWITWKDVFALVDIVCCCAVLFPIVWSIRHLRQAAQADGKASMNLEKLTQFRHFYILVVSYIYFTRIVVFLLRNTLPYQLEWLSYMSQEVATLLFYFVTGYYFRPVGGNPYLKVKSEDDVAVAETEMAETEFGLNDGSNA